MNKPVVIIGGGLGGLTAGVALARKGHRVTLFEKEPRVGGYAIAVRRKGRTYDLALHVTAAGGAGQEFHSMISALGLEREVSFIRLKESFRVFLGNYSFQMPNDYQALFTRLRQEFPAEESNLRAFQDDLEKHVNVYAPLFDSTVSKWQSVPPFLLRIPAFLKHAKMPTRLYLEQFFQDQRLMTILFQSSVFMGMPMDEFPTINFMMMFHVLFRHGLYTIAGGGQALTDALEKRFKALGGEIITGTKVTNILVEENTAVGVRTEDSKTYPASAVVSNVNIHDTVERLIGRSHFPSSYLKTLDGLRPSLSVLVLNLWLDCHPAEIGIDNHITIVFPNSDIDANMKKQRRGRFIDGFSITAHGNSEPAIQSPKHAALSVVGGTDPQQWLELRDEDYSRAKDETTHDVMDKLEKLFPGTAKHVTFIDLATPQTMLRYTGNPSGAIMGFECSCGIHRRIMEASRIPVRRLVPASAWTDRLGGFMQCVKAGMTAAEKITRKTGR